MSSTAQRAETRIYKEQFDQIATRYDRDAAIAANYGWGVSGGDCFLSVATKVYVYRQAGCPVVRVDKMAVSHPATMLRLDGVHL